MKAKQGNFEYEYMLAEEYYLDELHRNIFYAVEKNEVAAWLDEINYSYPNSTNYYLLFKSKEMLDTFQSLIKTMPISSVCKIMGIEDKYSEWERWQDFSNWIRPTMGNWQVSSAQQLTGINPNKITPTLANIKTQKILRKFSKKK